MNISRFSNLLFFSFFVMCINHAQTGKSIYNKTVETRIRVIIDNDFGGDPDDLFQLAHHLLSPSVEVKAIIGSKHYKNGFYGSSGSASYACEVASELLAVMGIENQY